MFSSIQKPEECNKVMLITVDIATLCFIDSNQSFLLAIANRNTRVTKEANMILNSYIKSIKIAFQN